MTSFGVGLGYDYGGIGVNSTIYLHQNLALFGGLFIFQAGLFLTSELK